MEVERSFLDSPGFGAADGRHAHVARHVQQGAVLFDEAAQLGVGQKVKLAPVRLEHADDLLVVLTRDKSEIVDRVVEAQLGRVLQLVAAHHGAEDKAPVLVGRVVQRMRLAQLLEDLVDVVRAGGPAPEELGHDEDLERLRIHVRIGDGGGDRLGQQLGPAAHILVEVATDAEVEVVVGRVLGVEAVRHCAHLIGDELDLLAARARRHDLHLDLRRLCCALARGLRLAGGAAAHVSMCCEPSRESPMGPMTNRAARRRRFRRRGGA